MPGGKKSSGGAGRGGGGGRLSADARDFLSQVAGMDTAGKLDALSRLRSRNWPEAMQAEARTLTTRLEKQLADAKAAAPALRGILDKQRALYAGRMSAGDRRRAAPKYADLKKQERALLRSVGLGENDGGLLLRTFR